MSHGTGHLVESDHTSEWNLQQSVLLLGLLALSIPIVLIGLSQLSVHVAQHDWYESTRPAALALCEGKSPYTVDIFYNPPWVAALVIPIAILPQPWSGTVLLLASLVTYIVVLRRLGASPITQVLWIFLPPVFTSLYAGQLEWLVVLSVILPARWGVFFAAIKPQVGMGLIVFWVFQAWRRGGLQEIVTTFYPFAVVTLLSFVMFGFWPERGLHRFSTEAISWNASLWPYGLVPGIGLLLASILLSKRRYALAASPLFSVYTSHVSYTSLLVGFVKRPVVLVIITVVLYLVW